MRSVDRTLGVTAAGGFTAAGVACGLKPSGEPDLALVVGPPGTVATGVFTTNLVVAAPVVWSRSRLAASPHARAVVANSGNANACTGPAGDAAVRASVEQVARAVGCHADQVLVCSTGLIGVPLDTGRVAEGIRKAAANLDRSGGEQAAEAIRTTDTVRKQAGVVTGQGLTVAGMAKGAAMLAPQLGPPAAGPPAPQLGPPHATMLAVLTTDAVAAPAVLQAVLAEAAERTFNRITVDGAQSTNDTVLLLASGAAGRSPDAAELGEAVAAVCDDLAWQMLADAEGATKVVRVWVGGAASEAGALAVARRVADSPLVKAAVYGGDPNWGRILQAAGTAGVAFDPSRVALDLDGVALVRDGIPTGRDPDGAMRGRQVELRLHLGGPGPWACIRTVDLTPDYVRRNSEYTT